MRPRPTPSTSRAPSPCRATPPSPRPTAGPNSLDPAARGDETADVTASLVGLRLWKGAEVLGQSQLDQGFGMSDTLGVAAFPPAARPTRSGKSSPYFYAPQRLFVRQAIDLGGDKREIGSGPHRASAAPDHGPHRHYRWQVRVTDVFDNNQYAHDPRDDFLNWAAIDTGTFDYAADAWGYTPARRRAVHQGPWTLRAGVFDLSNVPNSASSHPRFDQFQPRRDGARCLGASAGQVLLTGFVSRGRMGVAPRPRGGRGDRRARR